MGKEPVIEIGNDYLKQELAKARQQIQEEEQRTRKKSLRNPDTIVIEHLEQTYGVKFIEINMSNGNLHLGGFTGCGYKRFEVRDFEDHETSIRFGHRACENIISLGHGILSPASGTDQKLAASARNVMPQNAIQYAGKTKKVLEQML